MKQKLGKRLICLLLSVLLTAGLLPATAVRAEVTAENRFILVAESKSGLIIPPTYVTHAGGETTVLEALGNSGYTFTGLEYGMVTAIEDVSGAFSRSDEDGDYAFTKYASDITHYCFSERPSSESKPHEGLLLLMTAMADYLEETPDVQKAAKSQYQEARKLFVGIDSDSAKTQAKSLTDAMNDYKAILNGTTYEIEFTDGKKVYSDSEENYPGVTITAVNSYGRQWFDENGDGVLHLPHGTYEFSVQHKGLSVSGTLDASQTRKITAALKTEQWLTAFRLSGNYNQDAFIAGEFFVPEWNKDRHITVPVYDSFSGAVYTYAQYNKKLLSKVPSLTAVYTMKNAASTDMEIDLSFESWVSEANSVLAKGAEGNTVIYRVSSAAEDGYTYSQDYTVDFVRIPTLTAIAAKDQSGTDLAATERFHSQKQEYVYKVLNSVEKAKLSVEPLDPGYEIRVNGQSTADGTAEVEIDGKDVSVAVSANGYTNVYTLKFQPGEGRSVIFASQKEITLQVVNSNGVEIPYSASKVDGDKWNHYLFTLIPGETYNYVATYQEYYHKAHELVWGQNDGQVITVDFSDTKDWLGKLSFGTGVGYKNQNTLPLDKTFTPSDHHYQVSYVDTAHIPYVWVTGLDNDVDIQVIYNQLASNSTEHGVQMKADLASGADDGYKMNRFLMSENPIENTATIRLSKTINGVPHYQDYIVDFRRTLTLQSLSAKCDGVTTVLQSAEGTDEFTPGIKEYSVKVSLAAQELVLEAGAPQKGSTCYGEEEIGYTIRIEENGNQTVLKEKGSAVIALDGTTKTQTVSITVENEKAPEGAATYVVKILKAPPVKTTFTYSPQSALLNLREVLSNERLWPDADGTYQLCEGYSYDYVLTARDHVSKAGRLQVTQNADGELVIMDGEREYPVTAVGTGGAAEITWRLTEAEPNSAINPSMKSAWPNFRGNDSNNAVTDKRIPNLAENGTLYWANKIGSGIDSDAVGSPILVDGDIITYASNKIYRIDTITGKKVAEGTMDHKSSFSITPPAYAEGMVFVALSDGCVQAFNADTLESLWIYKDPLGGQPNCPITVKDGYLYTGFWNSETANANFVCLTIADENPGDAKEKKYASWFYTAKGGFYWAGAYVTADYVLVGTDDGTNASNSKSSRLLLLDRKTGRLLDSWNGLNGDIRSSVVYDNGSYYFTSKGGSFYCVQVSEGKLNKGWSVALENGVGGIPMSTSSPVVHNGRAYIGVSGAGQFSVYSGHNITVIDLASRKILYRVPTQGYPQTSGLLTTAYESEPGGYVYIYFFDNYTPGKLRVLRDNGQLTAPDLVTVENGIGTAYALFTPTGNQAQYAICSPITDEYGTIYFKNDSAHLMAFGSTVKELQVTAQPKKTEYIAGEKFNPAGMQITAVYANGKTRDVTQYVTCSTLPLTAENNTVTISYAYGMYQNKEDGQKMQAGITTQTPNVVLQLSVKTGILGDVNCDGIISLADVQMILDKEAQNIDMELIPAVADVSGDGNVDSDDAVLIAQYLEKMIEKFPAEENNTTEQE